MAGSAAGMLVAAFGRPAEDGGSPLHAVWASAGFTAPAVWSADVAAGPRVPWAAASAVMVLALLLA